MLKKIKKIILIVTSVFLLGACEQNKKTDQFVVGMECNYAPFNWTSNKKEGVKISDVDYCDGYDVEIAKIVAKSLGKELVIKKIAWEGLIVGINNNEIDAIIAGMTDTEKRREAVSFTSPYYESEMVIIVKNDSKYKDAKSLNDFSGAKILGQLNTLYDEVIDQIPNVKHQTPLANYPFMVTALNNGTVDGITAELPVAKGVVSSNKNLSIVRFEKDKGFHADTTVSIAVKKDRKELLEKIEEALKTIKNDDRLKIMEEVVNRQPAQQ